MKKIMCMLALALLAACATDYKQARRENGNGYFDTKLQEGRYEVSFNGNEQTTIKKANDFALLRSAEVCLENGYKSFEVVKKLDDSDDAAAIVTSTALAAAVTVANALMPDNEIESHPKITLEIRCSKGEELSYRAAEIKTNLRAKYKLPQ